MGSTPRRHRYQIPLPTRSTEASTECFGRLALSWFNEKEQTPASYFILGDVLHRGIEHAIAHDTEPDMMEVWLQREIDRIIKCAHCRGAGCGYCEGLGRIVGLESSKRGFDTIYDDAIRMMYNWFAKVHPDSSKRHPIYDDYVWPPTTEVSFQRYVGTRYPIWGSADTVFEAKAEGAPFEAPGYFLIVDWKSGTQRVKSDFQLNFYRLGLAMPKARAGFHHLDRVRDGAVFQEAADYPGDDAILDAIRKVEDQKASLLAKKLPTFTPDWYCNYCPVQDLCPADGDPRNRDANKDRLRRMIRLAVPMATIENGESNGTNDT